jgi:DNA repair exonuclease SbcCD nuclease subunit
MVIVLTRKDYMKILVIADLHFGAGSDNEVCASMIQILDRIKSGNDIGIIAIGGDVYNQLSRPVERNTVATWIKGFAEHAPVYIIKGNHDAPEDLRILSMLESCYSIYVDEIPCSRLLDTGVVLHTMPWFTKSGWMALNPGSSAETGDETVGQLALQFIRNNVTLNPQRKNILLGHLLINGARAQNHQPMIGQGITLGQYDLVESGLYAALLGHIHLKQTIGDNPLFFYPGSIAPLNYGETGEKYFCVLDTDTDQVEWIQLETVKRETFEVLWTPDEVKFNDPENKINKAKVRVLLQVSAGDDIEAAKQGVRNIMEQRGALECQVDVQSIPIEQIRSEKIASATSNQEKLEAYWEATGSEPDEVTSVDMIVKLSEIEEHLLENK